MYSNVKNCDESVSKPLGIIFWSCSENGKLLSEWKKTNVVPVFEKKQTRSKELLSHFFHACFKLNI